MCKVNRIANIVFIAGCVALLSCSRRAPYESQNTVRIADSLWTAGLVYEDSASLAQAYAELGSQSNRYPTEYAHACYHYGRLLRAKDNPVEAMRCFINATHTNTTDYHFLGRVYSNMGSICHLAGEYELSYNMFEKSANMFLQKGDSLLYYYGLNNMAYELAEQEKNEEMSALLAEINANCSDTDVLAKCIETKALHYKNTEQYDSVVEMVNTLQAQNRCFPTGLVLKASSYWHLEQRDSALFYARKVLNLSNVDKRDKFNMLYIVINGDTTLRIDEVKALSEQRTDLEMLELVPLHKKHAVAANELKQDLSNEQKSKFSLSLLIISSSIGIGIIFMVVYSLKLRKSKSQQQEILKEVTQQQTAHKEYRKQEIERACSAIRNERNWQDQINWKDFELLCEYIDKHFFFLANRLKEKKNLNEKEIRLCILVLLSGFSDKQMADILCYGEKSIRGIKRNTAKKIGTSSANLRVFLLNMLVQ